jgi:hypothetical protein
MSDDTRGIAGDRRRNPFPSLNDTEYELFLTTIERVVGASVKAAMQEFRADNCAKHIKRTDHLEAVVFGRTEAGVVGLDQRTAIIEGFMQRLDDDRVWFKRMVYSAFATAIVGVLIGVVQFVIIGR